MRTEVKEVKIFKYEELSVDAKDRVMDDYLQDNWIDLMNAAELYVTDELDYNFPKSDLKIQFDVSYSQGSGLNIYGYLDLTDLLEKLDNMTDEEKNVIKGIVNEIGECDMILKHNNRYTYLTMTEGDIYDYMEYTLSNDEYLEKIFNDNKELINKFDKEGYNYINDLIDMYYSTLKDMLDIGNIDMEELSDINDWEYLENGQFYVG